MFTRGVIWLLTHGHVKNEACDVLLAQIAFRQKAGQLNIGSRGRSPLARHPEIVTRRFLASKDLPFNATSLNSEMQNMRPRKGPSKAQGVRGDVGDEEFQTAASHSCTSLTCFSYHMFTLRP